MTLFGKKIEESNDIEDDDEEEYVVPPLPFYEEEIEGEGALEVNDDIERQPVSAPMPDRHLTGWGEWIAWAAITVVISWLVQCSVFQAFNVPSKSMEPSLMVGDSVIVNKIAYGFYFPEGYSPFFVRPGPERGDVVAFVVGKGKKIRRTFSFDEYLIKRVVAIPGDVVEVRYGRTYVNGAAVIESNPKKHFPNVNRETERLQAGEYFLLGDNAEVSEDSRFFGAISRTAIIGRVVMVYWSRENLEKEYKLRLNRIGKFL